VSDPVQRSLADTVHTPFWSDRPDAPEPGAPLAGEVEADLVVVGGGFTGLWACLLAISEDPTATVVLLESDRIGHGGTGRNGGFLSASLTHGLAHGAARWPAEMPLLLALGRANLAEIIATAAAEGIDASIEVSGKSVVATTDVAARALPGLLALHQQWGEQAELWDAAGARADVASPTYRGALRVRTGSALMNPARLAWGLAAAARRRGVRIHEGTRAVSVTRTPTGVRVSARGGAVTARRALLATGAYDPLLRRLRAWVLPVYDHVLVTEPLTADQRTALGWHDRQGITDVGNQFHYYRLTEDDRILWGGYDAIYYWGNQTDASREHRDASHQLLARQFFETFPMLTGMRFTHKWAGLIDTTSRFTPVFGTALGGRLAYAVGYTGLGTGAARFGAQVALDLLAGAATERTRLRMVRSRPVPFPPEPLRSAVVWLTRAELAREDRTGRRGPWLGMLDRLGVGFTS